MAELFPIIFLVVIIVAAIGAYYLLGIGRGQKQSESLNTTISTSVTSLNPTLPTTSTINTTTSTTTIPTYCRTNRSSVIVGNFSTGTWSGWTVSGTGFGGAPLNLTEANQDGDYYVNPWLGYNGEFAATTYQKVGTQIATLQPGNISTNFVVVEPYLNFQIYSPKDKGLYVKLTSSNGQSQIVAHYNTLNATDTVSEFASASINMSALFCQAVTLTVVSNVTEVTSSDQNQFIAVGSFYQSNSASQTSGALVNETYKIS